MTLCLADPTFSAALTLAERPQRCNWRRALPPARLSPSATMIHISADGGREGAPDILEGGMRGS